MIFPGALGDFLCFLPTLALLGERHAGAAVELMARGELGRLAAGRSIVVRAWSIDCREITALFSTETDARAEAQRFFGGFSFVYSFFASNDATFRQNLQAAARKKAAFYPFRAPLPGHVATGWLNSTDWPIGDDTMSRILAQPCLKVLNEDCERAADRLGALGLSPRRFVLLFPGSGGAHKNWPTENYMALGRAIERSFALRPVMVLGPAEAEMAATLAAISRETRGCELLSGLDLAEVLGLARLAAFFVGNDSGLSHLAAAAGAPGVALFGPTDPLRWRPLGNVGVIQHEPLAQLAVESVLSAIREAVSGAATSQVRQSLADVPFNSTAIKPKAKGRPAAAD